MPRWRLFYHVGWVTRGRQPAIDEEGARTVERSIRATCHAQRAIVHAVGVMPDHVHLAVSIPLSIAVSTFVGRIKGAASYLLNHTNGPPPRSPSPGKPNTASSPPANATSPASSPPSTTNRPATPLTNSPAPSNPPPTSGPRPRPRRGFVSSVRGLSAPRRPTPRRHAPYTPATERAGLR